MNVEFFAPLLLMLQILRRVDTVEDPLLDQYVQHVEDFSKTKREADPYKQWPYSEALDADSTVVLRWQLRHQEIAFRVEARTRGYVGVGFSPNGGMTSADMVLGWVDDRRGHAVLLDCHGSATSSSGIPLRDEVENYTLLGGSQNDTHTVLEFRRSLDTCDPDDFVLGPDTTKVIWAIHETDPQAASELVYHGRYRGEQSLHLFRPPPTPLPNNVQHWDVTLDNFQVPDNMNTIYWCKIFKAPPLRSKHHIVGFEPLVGKNHTKHAHHMLLHECQLPKEQSNRAMMEWDKHSRQPGVACYGNDMPTVWETCFTPAVAWAIGSKGESLPAHVGLPFGDGTAYYYMLEVHFDNPFFKKAVDTTGLRIHYTDRLRKHDAGILVTGMVITPLHVVPPGQPEYRSAGYCNSECTEQVFPKKGVNVVSVLLHSHLAGRKMSLRHIRMGKELSPLVKDGHYDFNYQQSRSLQQEVTILPGDSLVTECTYSTQSRSNPTLGGFSTSQEMCLAFVLHYPRTVLSECLSMPPVKYFFETFGVKEFYDKEMKQVESIFLEAGSETSVISTTSSTTAFPTFKPGAESSAEANQRAIEALLKAQDYTIDGNAEFIGNAFDRLIIREPQEFRNKSFTSHLNEIPWEEPLLTKRIEESFYSGQHLTFCRKRDDSLVMPERVEVFPNFTLFYDNSSQIQCSYKVQVQQPSAATHSTSASILISILPVVFVIR